MAEITITLQAASDANMTTTGYFSGTALEEGDARKVFGLPSMTVIGSGDEGRISFGTPRWDEVKPANSGLDSYLFKPDPTTTAFQLRCDQLSHEFQDAVTVSPIPAYDVRDETLEGAGTPGQLNQIVMAMGMRTETIKLAGVLVDRGLVTAANPRKQVLMTIARMQHLKIARGGNTSGWGGKHSNPMNPRSYPCLNIYDSLSPSGYSIGREPAGHTVGGLIYGGGRQYRGLIKDISFSLEGGRPDIWTWNITFMVVSNEHSAVPLLRPAWLSDVNRIRLVDEDGDALDNSNAGQSGFIEIRVSKDLAIKHPNGQVLKKMESGDIIRLSGTNSTPTINGEWAIQSLDEDDRTFVLKRASGNTYGEGTLEENTGAGASIVSESLNWAYNSWTNGTDGKCVWAADETCVP